MTKKVYANIWDEGWTTLSYLWKIAIGRDKMIIESLVMKYSEKSFLAIINKSKTMKNGVIDERMTIKRLKIAMKIKPHVRPYYIFRHIYTQAVYIFHQDTYKNLR